MFKKTADAPKPVSKREQEMVQERVSCALLAPFLSSGCHARLLILALQEEMRKKQAERDSVPQEVRDAKWAAFAADIEATEAAAAEGNAPLLVFLHVKHSSATDAPAGNARKMTFSGKSLKKLQLLSKAAGADGGDKAGLAYLKSGLGAVGAEEEEGLDGDLEEDEWDTLEEVPVLPAHTHCCICDQSV